MARRSPFATAWLWSGLGVLAALAAHALADEDGPPITARLPDEALRAENKTGAAATAAATEAEAAPEEKAWELDPNRTLEGDAILRGALSLDGAVEQDGRYEVELPNGARAVLTLDPKLQAAAERALARAKAPKAAAVVMSVDGRVLALAGRRAGAEGPDYDLPVSVWAPAASVFKLVTTAALLRSGFNPKRETCYHGGLRGIDKSHLVDSKRDQRCADLGEALSQSQNAVFAKLAHRHLDRSKLSAAARAFGMDWAPEWALEADRSRFEIPSDPLEFARVSCGFWKSEISPLSGAIVAGTIATGGLRVTPRIVTEIKHEDGQVQPVEAVEPTRVIPKKIARSIGRMMVATTETGTASRGFHDRRGRDFLPESVAGKTGSLTQARPTFLAFSWFVGYAPADEPEIVISVLLGNPERWYLKAHTAARLILDEIY